MFFPFSEKWSFRESAIIWTSNLNNLMISKHVTSQTLSQDSAVGLYFYSKTLCPLAKVDSTRNQSWSQLSSPWHILAQNIELFHDNLQLPEVARQVPNKFEILLIGYKTSIPGMLICMLSACSCLFLNQTSTSMIISSRFLSFFFNS